MLWNRNLRCETGFWDRRLKSLFIYGLFPGALAQTLQFFSFVLELKYPATARQSRTSGAGVQVAKLPAAMVPAILAMNKTRFRRVAKILSAESWSAEGERIRGGKAGSEVLDLTNA